MAAPSVPPAKADDPEAAVRREVVKTLKGPVATTFQTLLPALNGVPDPYAAIIEDHAMLDAAFVQFRSRRDAFADLLVDPAGGVVSDDSARLRCGRSVNEVIGMAVRSGMRAFAEQHFSDKVRAAKASGSPAGCAAAPRFRLLNLGKLAEMFSRNFGADRAPPAGQTRSGRFYAAIRDVLDYEWQVRFFPVYVEIPVHIIEKLGTGITRLDSEERIHQLAQLAAADIAKAEQIIKDPARIREMLDYNVLASAAIAEMGAQSYEMLQDAFEAVPPEKRWNIFANKDTLNRLLNDKRITKADIAALADYLDILNAQAVDLMLNLRLNRKQMGLFLKTAEDSLSRPLFLALFGPVQSAPPQDPAEQQRLTKYQSYTKGALKTLITAAKELGERGGGTEDLAVSMATVCKARRAEMEREVKKLSPAA